MQSQDEEDSLERLIPLSKKHTNNPPGWSGRSLPDSIGQDFFQKRQFKNKAAITKQLMENLSATGSQETSGEDKSDQPYNNIDYADLLQVLRLYLDVNNKDM